MLLEQETLLKVQPDVRPPDIGLTVLVRSDKVDADLLLTRIKRVWAVVASWGRWCDDEVGDWPSQEECLKSLPDDFSSAIRSVPEFEFENWLDDLHDRSWIWWSGVGLHNLVKIDLNTESMPASFWMLDFVAEKLGGQVVYRGEWKDSKASTA